MNRKSFTAKGTVAPGVSVMDSLWLLNQRKVGSHLYSHPLLLFYCWHTNLLLGFCLKMSFTLGVERLPYEPEGYNYWTWRGHKIHYVVQGEGPPVVLIHGFGASAFHWRFVPFCPFSILLSNLLHFSFACIILQLNLTVTASL